MIAEALVEAAAVGGIVMVWTKFTLETFKICKQIVYSNKQFYRCDECSNNFTKEMFSSNSWICKFCEEKDYLCDECHERFLDKAFQWLESTTTVRR